MDQQQKPRIEAAELMRDGNAFHLIGTARMAAQKAGWTAEQVSQLVDEMTSGDYSQVIRTITKHFDVR